jgi:hypothetical protein
MGSGSVSTRLSSAIMELSNEIRRDADQRSHAGWGRYAGRRGVARPMVRVLAYAWR